MIHKRIIIILKGIVIYLISTLLIGCASQGIKLDDRDRSRKFDGAWDVYIDIRKQYNIVGQRRYFCPKLNSRVTMYIADGQMSSLQTKKGDGYIKEDGTFYVNEQHGIWTLNEQHGIWPNIGSVKKREKHYVYSGRLNVNNGEGTVGIAYGLRSPACKGTVTIKKRGYYIYKDCMC